MVQVLPTVAVEVWLMGQVGLTGRLSYTTHLNFDIERGLIVSRVDSTVAIFCRCVWPLITLFPIDDSKIVCKVE